MARVCFLLLWGVGLCIVAACWLWWRAPLFAVQGTGGLVTASLVLVILPWLVGPGMVAVLRRFASGGVNLPHADYWFGGARRQSSLDRMAPYADTMASLLMVFLLAMLALEVVPALHGRQPSELMQFGAVAVFTLALVLWTRALMNAFPAPPPDDPALRTPRRPRRPEARR